MWTLRLTQASAGVDRYLVEAVLEGGDLRRCTSMVEFGLRITAQDREDMRWYLDDYLQYPADPAPQIAARIEERMVALGVELFFALFSRAEKAREFWTEVRGRLGRTRIEIVTVAQDASALPWELLRDPASKEWIALRSAAFVRAPWFREAIEAAEQCKSSQQAGMARFNLAYCHFGLGNLKDALSYANAALKDFCDCGTKGENFARHTESFIAQLRISSRIAPSIAQIRGNQASSIAGRSEGSSP